MQFGDLTQHQGEWGQCMEVDVAAGAGVCPEGAAGADGQVALAARGQLEPPVAPGLDLVFAAATVLSFVSFGVLHKQARQARRAEQTARMR
jgi:hypothetical protein